MRKLRSLRELIAFGIPAIGMVWGYQQAECSQHLYGGLILFTVSLLGVVVAHSVLMNTMKRLTMFLQSGMDSQEQKRDVQRMFTRYSSTCKLAMEIAFAIPFGLVLTALGVLQLRDHHGVSVKICAIVFTFGVVMVLGLVSILGKKLLESVQGGSRLRIAVFVLLEIAALFYPITHLCV